MTLDFSIFNRMELEFLRNASFSEEGAAWVPTNLAESVTMSWVRDLNKDPKDGSSFLRVSVTAAGGSVSQDVEAPLQQSYSLSLWLRAPGSPGNVPVQLALWALGGNQEVAVTSVSLDAEWTFVTVGLDVVEGGHTALRAELYINQAGATVDMDGSRLCNAGLLNASFSVEGAAWVPTNLAGSVTMTWIRDLNKDPKDGSSFLRVSVTAAGGSVSQDVPKLLPQHCCSFGLWLRAAYGHVRVPVTLTLWSWGDGVTSEAHTITSVAEDWTFVTVGLDNAHTVNQTVRAELYINQADGGVDMDGSRLWITGLHYASFSGGVETGWWVPEYLAGSVFLSLIEDPNENPKDGSSFLRVSVTAAGGSVRQDLQAPEGAGCYSLSLWLRAAPGSPGNVPVRLTLWSWGGGVQSNDDTFASVGAEWTLVTVGLDNAGGPGDERVVRAELYVLQANVSVDMDGAVLVARTPITYTVGESL